MVSDSAYQAVRQHAAAIERSDRGLIVVSGRDRAAYLQGLLTNDIAALKPGEGCYAAYLTPQGRMIVDLLVYELGDLILLAVPRAHTAAVLSKLDQFVFSEDVQLGDVTNAFFRIAIVGPDAATVLSGMLGLSPQELASLPPHGNRRAQFAGHPAVVTQVSDTGAAGFDLYVDQSQTGALQASLAAAQVALLDREAAEAIRIEAGIPRFDQDMDQETIPLEAGLEARAISLSKGCYVGQEVIIRVLHRGHGRVARKLVGLTLDGHVAPTPGSKVTAPDGREIGHITSGTWSPALGRPIALAYAHRDFLAAGTVVAVAGVSAVVTTLPFVQARA